MLERMEEEGPDLGPFFADVAVDGDESALRGTPAQPALEGVCVHCRLGMHDECIEFWIAAETAFQTGELINWNQCCCSGTFDLTKAFKAPSSLGAGGYVDGETAGGEEDSPTAYFEGFTGSKDPSEYKDANSTGRKMAAHVAPITPGLVCEWAWLAAAGGGVVPILGCPGRPASDRHHGPDKNTLRNTLGVNLHRICDWCHNQWHAKNDPFYGPRPTREDGTVDASVPFEPMAGFTNHPHDAITRAADQDVYTEDAVRREEARKHGAKI